MAEVGEIASNDIIKLPRAAVSEYKKHARV